MRIDNPSLFEGSDFENLTVDSGTSFPINEDVGELFFRTDLDALFVYDGVGWLDTTNGGALGATNHIDSNALNTLTTATSSVPLAIGNDQSLNGRQVIYDRQSIRSRIWDGAAWLAEELEINPDGGNVDFGATLSTAGNITVPGIDTNTSDFEITNTVSGGNIEFRTTDGVAVEQTSLLATGGDSVDLYFDGAQRFATATDGAVIDATNATLTLRDGDTETAILQKLATGELIIRNQEHGNNVLIQAEDAGGTTQDLVVGDPDGPTELYYDGILAASTDTNTFNVYSTFNDNAAFAAYQDDGATRNGFVTFEAIAGTARFVSEMDGALVQLQGNNGASSLTTLLSGDPDGVVDLRHGGLAVTETRAQGLNVKSATNNEPVLGLLNNTGTQLASITHNSTDLTVQNETDGGLLELLGTGTDTFDKTLLSGDPDAGVTLYRENTAVARTLAAASGGFEVNNTDTGTGFERVLTTSDLDTPASTVTITDAGGDTTTNVLLSADPTGDLAVLTDANITFDSSANIFSTITTRLGDGAVATPAFSFTSDPNSGMYLSGTDELSFATNGVRHFTIESNGTLNVSGTTNYETLVSDDDDIPNKAYLDNNFVPQTDVGAANGVASLDGNGLVPQNQLPAIALTETFVVASQAAQLALTAQTGDVAVRTDTNESYILQGTDPSVFGDWVELLTSGSAVTSVDSGDGLTGGPITSTGTLSVDYAGSGGSFGTATTVARSDHDHLEEYDLNDLANVTETTPGTGEVLYKSAGDWVNTDAILIDPTDAVELSFNGEVTALTHAAGLDVQDASGSPALRMRDSTTQLVSIFYNDPSSELFIDNQVDSATTVIRGRDALSANSTMAVFDPTGSTDLYHAGEAVFLTQADGIRIQPNAASNNGIIRFDDGAGEQGLIAKLDAGYVTVRNAEHGGTIRLEAEDSGGNIDRVFDGDPDGSADLYYAGNLIFSTTADGFDVFGALVDQDNSSANVITESKIRNDSGGVMFRVQTDGDAVIQQISSAGAAQDIWVSLNRDDSVGLHYNGFQALVTESTGVRVTGGTFGNAAQLAVRPGSSDDAIVNVRSSVGGGSFWHENSTNDLYISNTNPSGTIQDTFILMEEGAAVTLYHDGTAAARTTATDFEVWDGSAWQGVLLSTTTLGGLSDTNITAAATGDILYWDGTDWVNDDAITVNPTGAVTIDHNGNQVFTTRGDGATIQNTNGAPGDNTIFQIDDADGESLRLVKSGSGPAVLRNFEHGGNVQIQGETTGGALRNLFVGDPDADVKLFYDGTEAFATATDGIQIAPGDGGANTRITAYDAIGGTARWWIQNTAGQVALRSFIDGATLNITGNDSSSVNRNILTGDPDGSVDLFHQGVLHMSTYLDTDGGRGIGVGNGANDILIRDYTSAETDITGEVAGSVTGGIIEGPASAHVVVGIRGNDNSDGFHVIDTNLNASGAYARKLFHATGANCELWNDGGLALRTTDLGIDVFDGGAGGVDPRINLRTNAGALSSRLFNSSGNLFLDNINHGGALIIRGEDAGGTTRTMATFDPDAGGSVLQSSNGAWQIEHNGETTFQTTINGADVTAQTGNAAILDVITAATSSSANIGMRTGSNGARMRVLQATGQFQLYQTAANGSTLEDLWINCDRNDGVTLYNNNLDVLRTEPFGVSILDGSGTAPAISLRTSADAEQSQIFVNNGTQLFIDHRLDGQNIVLRGRSSASANRDLIDADPDGNIDFYGNGTLAFSATGGGTRGITSNGNVLNITVDDDDFVVRDSTDTVSNFIWRDHSASILYLGTDDAVVNFRSAALALSGTASTPAFAFTVDPDTGMFRRGANDIGWSCGGTERLYLLDNGDLVADGNVTANSDIKLKENLEVISNASEKVKQLNGYTYNLKEDQTKTRKAGVIAQEVEKVLPEVVLHDEVTDTKSVAYGNMVALLIESQKEMMAKIEALEAELAELKK